MPLKLRLVQDFHNIPAAGHLARSKTLELLACQYYWRITHKDVDQYLRNFHTCQRSRTSCHGPFGILRPLPIPNSAWRLPSMDFILGLPWSNGFNSMLVVVCRLTKMRILSHAETRAPLNSQEISLFAMSSTSTDCQSLSYQIEVPSSQPSSGKPYAAC